MRIVTWNCCGKFCQKARHIAAMKPDILAVQEVEALGDAPKFSGDIQPTYSHRAALRPIPKSIGIFSYTDTSLDALCVMPGVRCYRARHYEHHFQIMAVWTSVSASGKQDYRQLHDVLDHHDGWIRQWPTIVLGDFNQSARYKGDGWTTLQKLMDGLGLVSAFHSHFGEDFGQETRATHYHQLRQDKPFHLDYCFLPRDWARYIAHVSVGTYDEWNGISDHVPLIVDIDFEQSSPNWKQSPTRD
jgi:endonuclease/exonuclease/phosphatase family metal-dependent hydrolase